MKGIIMKTDMIIFNEIGDNYSNITLEIAKRMIDILNPYCDKLRKIAHDNSFSEDDEIVFFKEIKPNILGKIKYFTKVYEAEINKSYVNDEVEYYKELIYKMQESIKKNTAIYKYYRSGATNLDKYYFTRASKQENIGVDFISLEKDPLFSTIGDAFITSIKANDMLYIYLTEKIKKLLDQDSPIIQPPPLASGTFKWTDTKIAAIELGYALFSRGVINNGTADIKEIMQFLEQIFNIELGDYYRSYLSIRERKKDKTIFLSSLIDSLNKKMNEDDSR